MILALAVFIRIATGQLTEPLSMASVVYDETNKETLKAKNLERKQQIDSRDPYKDREPEVGGHTYPIIFEPIQNVEFSRSVYKTTSMVVFTPYVEYFRKYEHYLTKLYRDIRKEERLK